MHSPSNQQSPDFYLFSPRRNGGVFPGTFQRVRHNDIHSSFYYGEKKKEEKQIRFDDKCITAKNIGLLHDFENSKGQIIDLPSEIIEFYWYRNGIHLIAEQRKGIQYELELSKRAYRRMQPFIEQIKSK